MSDSLSDAAQCLYTTGKTLTFNINPFEENRMSKRKEPTSEMLIIRTTNGVVVHESFRGNANGNSLEYAHVFNNFREACVYIADKMELDFPLTLVDPETLTPRGFKPV